MRHSRLAEAKRSRHNASFDGLRGAAALSIVVMHFSIGKSSGVIPCRAYLAVDFFFLLSGFVLADAYERRMLGGMGKWQFIRARIIRLYPMIFLGMLVGACDAGFNIFRGHPAFSISELSAVFLGSLALIPAFFYRAAPLYDFPLDTPIWSLMFEGLVNLAYALTVRFLNVRVLTVIVALSWCCLVTLALQNNGLSVGPLTTEIPAGLVRVVFSFGLGVLLCRAVGFGLFSRLPRISGLWMITGLVVSFLPWGRSFGWAYDLCCVSVLYPGLLVFAASDQLSERWVGPALFAGRISYPLYALHVPLVLEHFGRCNGFEGAKLALAIGAVTVISIVVAWAALKFYDEPLRAYFQKDRVPDAIPARLP